MISILQNYVAASPIVQMGLIILAILTLASGIVLVLGRVFPEKDFSELDARVRAWWAMAAIFFAVLMANAKVAIGFFTVVSFWALKEYLTLLKTRRADHRALLCSFAAIPFHYYWIASGWYGMFIIFIPVYVFLCLPVMLVTAKETRGFMASISQIQWGLMAFVFGLSHLAFLLILPRKQGDGRMLLLFLVFVVQMSDVLQYVWGKTVGRHPILPAISPNKTWEGFLGGIASATGLSLLIRSLTPFSIMEAALVSLLITLAGFFGGAVMSAIKRDLGVKDFGTSIPGHGGVIDRIDSLCYAAPVFFHYVRYFY